MLNTALPKSDLRKPTFYSTKLTLNYVAQRIIPKRLCYRILTSCI